MISIWCFQRKELMVFHGNNDEILLKGTMFFSGSISMDIVLNAWSPCLPLVSISFQ